MTTEKLSPQLQSKKIEEVLTVMEAEILRLRQAEAAAQEQIGQQTSTAAENHRKIRGLEARLSRALHAYTTFKGRNRTLLQELIHEKKEKEIVTEELSSIKSIYQRTEPKEAATFLQTSILDQVNAFRALTAGLLLAVGLHFTYTSTTSDFFKPFKETPILALPTTALERVYTNQFSNSDGNQPNIYPTKKWFEIAPGWDKVMGEQESEPIEDKISSSAATTTFSVVPPLAVSKTEIETQEKITPLTPSTSAGSVPPVNQPPKISSFACLNPIRYADREKSLCTLVAEDDYQVDTCQVEYVVSHEGKRKYHTRYLTGPGEQKKTFAFSASLTCDAVGYPCNVEMDAVCYDQQEQKSNGKNRKTVIQAEVEKEVETGGEYQAKVKKDVEAQGGAEVETEIGAGVKATVEVEPTAGVETRVVTIIDTQKPTITGQCPDKISYQRRQDSICSLVASDNVALSKCEVTYGWSNGNDIGQIMDTIPGDKQATLDLKLRVKGCPNETIPCKLTMHVSCYDVSQNKQDASYTIEVEAKSAAAEVKP